MATLQNELFFSVVCHDFSFIEARMAYNRLQRLQKVAQFLENVKQPSKTLDQHN
jgi:hypothetical protein